MEQTHTITTHTSPLPSAGAARLPNSSFEVSFLAAPFSPDQQLLIQTAVAEE